MLDHVSLGVKDLERSRRFYDAALHPLGLVRTVDFQGRGSDYAAMAGQFWGGIHDYRRNRRVAPAGNASVLPRLEPCVRGRISTPRHSPREVTTTEATGLAPAVSPRLLRGLCRRSRRAPYRVRSVTRRRKP